MVDVSLVLTGHQGFVRHGIDDGADNSLKIPFPGNPAIDQIRGPGVKEKAKGGKVLLVEDEITDNRSSNKSREGQDIGNGVYVLMRRQRS
ncbi:MAG: hypothetical protein LQ337_001959 [Flavoplaca oasis]|nr:MAG: hypothetical protein LQ337_001959 [Flavoplaca oasis]